MKSQPSKLFFSLFFITGCYWLFVPHIASASGLIKPANSLGLVGYWSFEDATGTKATDFSGNRNIGTLTNFASPPVSPSGWTSAGKRASALAFDGTADSTGDYVSVAENGSVLDPAAITLSAWIYPTSAGTGNIINKGNNSGYRYRMASDRSVGFLDRGATNQISTAASLVPLNTWSHVVAVGDSGGLKIYFNGLLAASNTTAYAPGDNSDPLTIGTYQQTEVEHFAGSIDEARVYNRALSSTEVAYLYATGISKLNSSKNTVVTAGLKGLWSFDGGDISGTTAYNRTGFGNNGTISGATTKLGKIGQGLFFDGVDDQVDAGVANSAYPINGALSYSAWIKPSTSSGVIMTIRCVPGEDVNAVMWLQGTNAVSFRRSSSGVAVNYQTNSNAITLGTWNHVVVTWGGTMGSANTHIYVDGVEATYATNDDGSGSASDLTDHSLFIGRSACASNPFSGIIDDARVYNRVLSVAEVTQLYRLGAGAAGINRSNVGVPGTSNLVFWHTFDGSKLNTTTSTDSSSQARNGTLTNGPVPTIGRVGQGLKMDGSDDRVVISTTSSVLNQSGSYTITAWARNDDIAGGAGGVDGQAIISTIGNGGNGNSGDFWFGVDQNARVRFSNWRASGGSSDSVRVDENSGGMLLSDRVWYHYAAVWNGSNSLIYINGVNQALTTGLSSGSGDSLGTYLGTLFTGAANYHWQGIIDDVRVYNRALTAAEILQLYNTGK